MGQHFRSKAVATLTGQIGVYGLIDLDGVPLYIGQSVDGIRQRVQRHLTSARSDIIANRQIDIWEVAEVWAWPVEDRSQISPLEAGLFAHFDAISALMNGSIPHSDSPAPYRSPAQIVEILGADDRRIRLDPSVRLPRQIEQYQRLVDHILVVKDAAHLRRSVDAHYARLSRYHAAFLHRDDAPLGSEDAKS